MERQLRKTNEAVSQQIRKLRKDIHREFGFVSRMVAAASGPFLLWTSRREEKRLAGGVTYEPPTFRERSNWSPETSARTSFQTAEELPVEEPAPTV